MYLRRTPGTTSFYAEGEAVWLVWNDDANVSRLQVLARVRHGDDSGLRLQFGIAELHAAQARHPQTVDFAGLGLEP